MNTINCVDQSKYEGKYRGVRIILQVMCTAAGVLTEEPKAYTDRDPNMILDMGC